MQKPGLATGPKTALPLQGEYTKMYPWITERTLYLQVHYLPFIWRLSMKFFLSSIILLVFCSAAIARQEDVYASGPCEDGGTWWHVTRTINGRACQVWGVDCTGILYSRDLNCMNVSADPTGGIYTHTGVGDNGVNWYMRIIRNADRRITWIGGRDQNGIFYETEIMYGNPGPGDLD